MPAQGTAAAFRSLLGDFRLELEGEIELWLAAKERELAGEDAALAAAGGELIAAARELVQLGGKRLRPALVYGTYRACGGTSREAALPLALATELFHAYLLIHDDVMDHAETRRGRPAAHARFREAHRESGWNGDAADFGRSAAILVGDLAHSWAVELFTGSLLHAPRPAELGQCFAAMGREVVAGQYLELQVAARRGGKEQAGAAELLSVLRAKSGRYSVERPIQLGALLAGAGAERLEILSRYGAAMGEAFQLQDDLLGVFGDAEAVGKPVGSDLQEGKFTFLVFHAFQAASAADRELLDAALGNPDLDRSGVEAVRRVLERTGARGAVEAMIAERLTVAREALDELAFSPLAATFFPGLLDYLERRDR